MNIKRSVAVLITCFNRKEATLKCLEALFVGASLNNVKVSVYLVDDGSTDGTSALAKSTYPQVQIFQGNGDLYWAGGMRLAFDKALEKDYDFYLWLNDDTLLYPHALKILLEMADQAALNQTAPTIVVGTTQNPCNGEWSYGGRVRKDWWHPFHLCLVTPNEFPQPCDTMDGNCVLIPREIAKSLGNLDPSFSHYAADYDYGLRARNKGYSIWVAPNSIGTCSPNPPSQRLSVAPLSAKQSIEKIKHPKGLATQDVTLHPFREWKVFTQRHGGYFWFVYWLFPYRRLVWKNLKYSFLKLING